MTYFRDFAFEILPVCRELSSCFLIIKYSIITSLVCNFGTILDCLGVVIAIHSETKLIELNKINIPLQAAQPPTTANATYSTTDNP